LIDKDRGGSCFAIINLQTWGIESQRGAANTTTARIDLAGGAGDTTSFTVAICGLAAWTGLTGAIATG
jgi:hypothetical protein